MKKKGNLHLLNLYGLVSRMDSAVELRYYTPSYQCVYFDKKGRIRKLIDFSEYLPTVSRIGYYDESGDLIYSVSYDAGEGIVERIDSDSEELYAGGKIELKANFSIPENRVSSMTDEPVRHTIRHNRL